MLTCLSIQVESSGCFGSLDLLASYYEKGYHHTRSVRQIILDHFNSRQNSLSRWLIVSIEKCRQGNLCRCEVMVWKEEPCHDMPSV
jgi:hypothetical protein